MTLTEWRQAIEIALADKEFPNATQEAKWLLAGALNKTPAFIILESSYTPSEEEEIRIQDWLHRRLKGEPLARLKGVREFWSLPFELNESTLDPRPESELIVEAVLDWVGGRKDEAWKILDLGTGSGCLLISLLTELPQARGTGIDCEENALSMARTNAEFNKVSERTTFQKGNWAENLTGPYDIIVSNPPYIPLKDKDSLDKEVLHFDPSQALFGGEDGLNAYQTLAPDIKRLISPEGIAVLEMGYGQRQDIEHIFKTHDFDICLVRKDHAGIDRVIEVKIKPLAQ